MAQRAKFKDLIAGCLAWPWDDATINISSTAAAAATVADPTVHTPAADDGTATGIAAIVAHAANAIVAVVDVAVAAAATAVAGTIAEGFAAATTMAAIAAAAAAAANRDGHASAAAVAAAAASAVAVTLRAIAGNNRHSDSARHTNRIARHWHRRRPAAATNTDILSPAAPPGW